MDQGNIVPTSAMVPQDTGMTQAEENVLPIVKCTKEGSATSGSPTKDLVGTNLKETGDYHPI